MCCVKVGAFIHPTLSHLRKPWPQYLRRYTTSKPESPHANHEPGGGTASTPQIGRERASQESSRRPASSYLRQPPPNINDVQDILLNQMGIGTSSFCASDFRQSQTESRTKTCTTILTWSEANDTHRRRRADHQRAPKRLAGPHVRRAHAPRLAARRLEQSHAASTTATTTPRRPRLRVSRAKAAATTTDPTPTTSRTDRPYAEHISKHTAAEAITSNHSLDAIRGREPPPGGPVPAAAPCNFRSPHAHAQSSCHG